MKRDKVIKLVKMLILATVFAGCLSFTACKEDKGEFVDADNATSGSELAYSFIYNGYNIDIGQRWSDVSGKLGDYNSTFVAESCAYQGTDRYYYYNDFEIMTSEIDGEELVTDIFIEKENVEAAGGVCVGMSLADVAKKMGPADKTTENGLVYYGGSTNVQINTRDDKVVSVEYYYVQD